jgi:hypothetical protein
MTVFNTGPHANTTDFKAGDVGLVRRNCGHYVENTGDDTLIMIETFRADQYEEVSLANWLAHLPPKLVSAHLNIPRKPSRASRAAHRESSRCHSHVCAATGAEDRRPHRRRAPEPLSTANDRRQQQPVSPKFTQGWQAISNARDTLAMRRSAVPVPCPIEG